MILYEESDVESSSDEDLSEPGYKPGRCTENRLIATLSTLSDQHSKNSECHKEMREECMKKRCYKNGDTVDLSYNNKQTCLKTQAAESGVKDTHTRRQPE